MLHLRAIVFLVPEDARAERERSVSNILIFMDLELLKILEGAQGQNFVHVLLSF